MSSAETREIPATTLPIAILLNPTAQTLSHVQPIILASYFYLRFGALVANPISTLTIDLLPVAILQAVYAVICLPLSKKGSAVDQIQNATTTKSKTSKPKSGRTTRHEVELSAKIPNAIISLILTAIITIPVFVLLVLFGAPLTTHHAQTLLTAAHFSLLAIFPLFYTHGVDSQSWWEIGGAMLPFDSVWGTAIGTALGAWLGAVPIPLDWDREWQKWPVTIVAGMYAGALVGNYAGRYLLYGKRIKFTSDTEDKQDFKKTS